MKAKPAELDAIDQTNIDVRIEKLRILRRDDDVAISHQVPAAANAVAIHRADERLADGLHHVSPRLEDRIAFSPTLLLSLLRGLGHKHAAAKGFITSTGKNHHPLLGIIAVFLKSLKELGGSFDADGVHPIRPIERHADDPAAAFQQNIFELHGHFLSILFCLPPYDR